MSKEGKYRVCDKCGVMFPQENLCSECCVEGIEEYCTSHKEQPKLSIPKKIAEELDKFFEIDFESLGHEEWWIQEHELIEWFSKTPNCYIKDAYLAGKALGVELVEVVE